jgi:hypothetical protein
MGGNGRDERGEKNNVKMEERRRNLSRAKTEAKADRTKQKTQSERKDKRK